MIERILRALGLRKDCGCGGDDPAEELVQRDPRPDAVLDEARDLALRIEPDPDAVLVAPGTWLHHGLYLRNGRSWTSATHWPGVTT